MGTALHSLLFSGGISVSFTYKLWSNHENVRADTTFDIVHYTYIHGGLSLNREGTASLLARDARYIAHARTHTHRTRLAALSTPFCFACILHARSSSGGHHKVAMPYAHMRADEEEGVLEDGRREKDPERSAKRQSSG